MEIKSHSNVRLIGQVDAPVMRAEHLTEEEKWHCIWFINGILKHHDFEAEDLWPIFADEAGIKIVDIEHEDLTEIERRLNSGELTMFKGSDGYERVVPTDSKAAK